MRNRLWALAAVMALAMAPPVRAAPGSTPDPRQRLSLVVSRATTHQDASSGQRMLDITLAPQSRAAFAAFTERLVGRRIALLFEGRVLSQPVLREPIRFGSLTISPGIGNGAMTPAAIDAMAARLASGNATLEVELLPAPP